MASLDDDQAKTSVSFSFHMSCTLEAGVTQGALILQKLESPTKGRRHIKEVMSDAELVRETRLAARAEAERLKRIAERQEMVCH